MNLRAVLLLGALVGAIPAIAWATDRMQFWNLTGVTIARLYLAPSGTSKWGPNQCANDKDGAVESDERLALTGVQAGRYDVTLTDVNGRTCLVRNVALEAGKAYAFSLAEADLKDCRSGDGKSLAG